MMQTNREQTTIRLPAGLKEQLQREADRRGDSFNETVIRLRDNEHYKNGFRRWECTPLSSRIALAFAVAALISAMVKQV